MFLSSMWPAWSSSHDEGLRVPRSSKRTCLIVQVPFKCLHLSCLLLSHWPKEVQNWCGKGIPKSWMKKELWLIVLSTPD